MLRMHRLDDFNDLLAMWADPQIYRYITGKPIGRSEAWNRLLRYVGHWALLGYGYWVISDRHDGSFLGEVGFANYQREVTPSLDGMPEMGWAVVSASHGQGIASEAIAAIMAWGDQRFAGRTMACMIDPDNTASIGLAEKFGFEFWADTSFADQATRLYRRTCQTGSGS